MAQVNMPQVKELRERTQAGLSDCKNALVEADGDMDKAVEIILKKGLAKSAKRAGAVATEGEVAARGRRRTARAASSSRSTSRPTSPRATTTSRRSWRTCSRSRSQGQGRGPRRRAVPGGGGTVEETRQALVGKLGENIVVRRWERLASQPARAPCTRTCTWAARSASSSRSRPRRGRRQEARVRRSSSTTSRCRSRRWRRCRSARATCPKPTMDKQKEIFDGAAQAEEGKPEAAWPKIIEGKVAKWIKEVCLLEQQSVIETDKTVDRGARQTSRADLGADVEVDSLRSASSAARASRSPRAGLRRPKSRRWPAAEALARSPHERALPPRGSRCPSCFVTVDRARTVEHFGSPRRTETGSRSTVEHFGSARRTEARSRSTAREPWSALGPRDGPKRGHGRGEPWSALGPRDGPKRGHGPPRVNRGALWVRETDRNAVTVDRGALWVREMDRNAVTVDRA